MGNGTAVGDAKKYIVYNGTREGQKRNRKKRQSRGIKKRNISKSKKINSFKVKFRLAQMDRYFILIQILIDNLSQMGNKNRPIPVNNAPTGVPAVPAEKTILSQVNKNQAIKGLIVNSSSLQMVVIIEKKNYYQQNLHPDQLSSIGSESIMKQNNNIFNRYIVTPKTVHVFTLKSSILEQTLIKVLIVGLGKQIYHSKINDPDDLRLIIFKKNNYCRMMKKDQYEFASKIEEKGYFDPRNSCQHEVIDVKIKAQTEKIQGCYKCLILKSKMIGMNPREWHRCLKCQKIFCSICFEKKNKRQPGNDGSGGRITVIGGSESSEQQNVQIQNKPKEGMKTQINLKQKKSQIRRSRSNPKYN